MTRLGVPWIWGGDVEKGWIFMRFNVVPITTMWMAPGSWAYGTDRIPLEGGAVLAVNHLSAIDPPLVGSFSNRAIWYMMKQELLEIPVVGEALTWSGAFPVKRGGQDREALRYARELVREGHIVGVFVEGTRQRFGYPGEIQTGALTIAMKDRMPFVTDGPDGPLPVDVVVQEHAAPGRERSDGAAMAAALEELAVSPVYRKREDPVRWQRMVREDRPLPGRD